MAKPINKNMETIALKYRTGQYGVNELARIYKVDKATISRYFKKHGIVINQHAKTAINALSVGLSELNKVMDTAEINQQNAQNGANTQPHANATASPNASAQLAEIASAKDISLELANEVVNIVRERNPQFAKGFQALSALIIKRSSEILQAEKVTASDIAQISKAMSNVNDTLGVIPKAPTIAQQFNFSPKSNKGELKPIDLEIKFIDSKENK